MSTRAVIARYQSTTRQTWAGVYHHWDGYPSGLGCALWHIYHSHYPGQLSAMLRLLIDAHPAGWSTIVGRDFRYPPTWLGVFEDDQVSPLSYTCRGESPSTIRSTDLKTWCEWAYVFDESAVTMTICLPCPDRWEPLATIDLHGSEPDWAAFEQRR